MATLILFLCIKVTVLNRTREAFLCQPKPES